MLTYLRVFNFLWRAKRIEYYVANVWKDMMFHFRTLHKTKGNESRCGCMTSVL